MLWWEGGTKMMDEMIKWMRTKLDKGMWSKSLQPVVCTAQCLVPEHEARTSFLCSSMFWHAYLYPHYTNAIFILMPIICLGLPPPTSSLCPWPSGAFISGAVSPLRQLFTQSARKLALNMAIRWHTESRNRHNQSNTDVISNFIVFLSHTFTSHSICAPPPWPQPSY